MNEFYLVKVTSNTQQVFGIVFYIFLERFSHIRIFFTVSLNVSDTHILCIYVRIDDMMSRVLYV